MTAEDDAAEADASKEDAANDLAITAEIGPSSLLVAFGAVADGRSGAGSSTIAVLGATMFDTATSDGLSSEASTSDAATLDAAVDSSSSSELSSSESAKFRLLIFFGSKLHLLPLP